MEFFYYGIKLLLIYKDCLFKLQVMFDAEIEVENNVIKSDARIELVLTYLSKILFNNNNEWNSF